MQAAPPSPWSVKHSALLVFSQVYVARGIKKESKEETFDSTLVLWEVGKRSCQDVIQTQLFLLFGCHG